MGFNATYRAFTQIVGGGFGSGGVPYIEDTEQTTPTNTNAPPPGAYQLQVGNNTLVVPSGFTVSRMHLLPPAGSSNTKTLKGIAGDTGFPGWTVGSVTVSVVAGQTFVVVSSQIETLAAAFS